MPRITADSVAEHVAQQEAAVFETAIRLFAERGYSDVSMADIANSVGLARNSLYRYFPDKTHILVRWFRAELPVQARQSAELLAGPGAPIARINAWATAQLDYALTPEHALIAALADVVPHLDEETRRELASSHEQVRAPMIRALGEAGVKQVKERVIVADLLGGMVLAASKRETRGEPDQATRRCLQSAITAVVHGARTSKDDSHRPTAPPNADA